MSGPTAKYSRNTTIAAGLINIVSAQRRKHSRGRRKSRRVDSGREGEVEGQGKGAASCDSNINNLDQHAAAGTVAGKADGGIQRERERRKAKQGRGRTQLQTVKM